MDSSEQTPPKKVGFAFCSHDRVHPGTMYDAMHLVGHMIATGGYVPETNQHHSLALDWCQTSMLPEGRRMIVQDLKDKGADKLLFFDTDMRFPRQSLHMLLRHDVPIVGVNYPSRRPPYRYTAATMQDEPLITRPESTGLVEVAHVGFGFILLDMSIFADDDGPWFSFDWYRREDGKWGLVGEDVTFCREMRARGHKIYVDQELSASIGHEGDFIFTANEMAEVLGPEKAEAVEA